MFKKHMMAALLAAGLGAAGAATAAEVTVYKSPYCGCCGKWVEHMRASGFDVVTKDVEDVAAIKQRYGVPAALGSCHTAVVGRYVLEGHVPAADVERLLVEAPSVTGVAVPGMPAGSPGMEGAYSQPYQSIAFSRNGNTAVFAEH